MSAFFVLMLLLLQTLPAATEPALQGEALLASLRALTASVWVGNGSERPADPHHAARHTWNYTLQPHQLRRSIAYEGSGNGLHRLVAKLRAHQRVVVTAVGGSVTHGHSNSPGSGMDNPARGFAGSWSRLVFDYISARWPHPEGHVYVNAAVPGTGAMYFGVCLRRHVHPATDLALLEFGVNDAKFKDMEAVFRRLMAYPGGGPALLHVSFWSKWPYRPGVQAGPYRPKLSSKSHEPGIGLLAAYYDIAAVRNSVTYAATFLTAL